MAAVDSSDVLSGLDLSYSGRGRRRVGTAPSDATTSTASTASTATTSSSSVDEDAADATSTSTTITTTSSSSTAAAVEAPGSDPDGPPPLLSVGDDDIFWLSKLHNALMGHGFYPSDDEVRVVGMREELLLPFLLALLLPPKLLRSRAEPLHRAP
jgi:hypothetical protein